jgi:hypothetical protein
MGMFLLRISEPVRKHAQPDEAQQADPEDSHVEGKNPVGPANIKRLEVMRRIFYVEKNAANQETGQHEEQGFPVPTCQLQKIKLMLEFSRWNRAAPDFRT